MELENGRIIKAATIFWAGGIRGSRVLERSGFPVNRQGRANVTACLTAEKFEDVYIIGDCAVVLDAEGKPLPPTSQLAVEQGKYAAQSIKRIITGKAPDVYSPRMKGIVVSLGRKDALAVIYNYRFSGRLAAILKDFIAYRYLWSIGDSLLVARKFLEWAPLTSAMRLR